MIKLILNDADESTILNALNSSALTCETDANNLLLERSVREAFEQSAQQYRNMISVIENAPACEE